MIGVLVSGRGTNLQALLDEGLPVVAVASNDTKAQALDRARARSVSTVSPARTGTRSAAMTAPESTPSST